MRIALLLLAGGCDAVFNLKPISSDAAAIDSGDDRGDGRLDGDVITELCVGTDDAVCLVTLPSEPITYSGMVTIDTDTAPCVETTTTSEVCVLAATSIRTTADLRMRITGARPLVLLSTGAIELVEGAQIDGAIGGPGALAGMCIDPTPPAVLGRGGGAGGSFGARGGNGGPNAGGLASSGFVPPRLSGGCPGTVGGSMADGAGVGGGAIALIAREIVTVHGSINVSGGGGTGGSGGTMIGGGGGGGSGGMIMLDGGNVAIGSSAILLALGGGGGEGGSATTGGTAGQSGNVANPDLPAAGGQAGSAGGDGGAGGYDGIGGPGLIGTPGTIGGGGGGGGAGVILARSATVAVGGTIHPVLLQ